MNPFPVEKIKERIKELDSVSFERFSDDSIFSAQLKLLFSDAPRRTGRSFLLTRIQIENSIEEGKEINLIDHYYQKKDAVDYQDMIFKVLEWYESHDVKINFTWRPSNNGIIVGFTLHSSTSYENYSKIRIPLHTLKIKEETQFSKLLLII